MRNKFITVPLLLLFMVAGCAQSGKEFSYEEDTSYETELYGTYSENYEDSKHSRSETYTFKPDGTYSHKRIDVWEGRKVEDIDKSGKVISCDEVSDGLFKIVLSESFAGENVTVYKYRNMIGSLEEETPDGTTFEVPHEDGRPWSSRIGMCVKKGDIVYGVVQNTDNYCRIDFYITDKGLFAPEVYKEE